MPIWRNLSYTCRQKRFGARLFLFDSVGSEQQLRSIGQVSYEAVLICLTNFFKTKLQFTNCESAIFSDQLWASSLLVKLQNILKWHFSKIKWHFIWLYCCLQMLQMGNISLIVQQNNLLMSVSRTNNSNWSIFPIP